MNIHEYQAKQVLAKYGVAIPKFAVASNLEEAKKAVHDMGLKQAVVKIQVHAGGRGKAGGVKFAKTPEDIIEACKKLIGMKMVNNQTGADGVVAHKVIITAPVDIKKEYYLGAIIDREHAKPTLICSPEGGMDIEEVAHTHPERILTVPFGFDGTVRTYQLIEICKFMGWTGPLQAQGMKMVAALAKAFIQTDASLLEINPLVETVQGELWAVDAKLSIDDNALFRQKEIAAFYDPSQSHPNEVEAQKHNLAYIGLDGNIACLVNGAGLAMATMDIIKHYGGQPANFLDVGGSATTEVVTEAFRIILADPKVKAIFVNIFGGIMNCATVAEGIVAAAKQVHLKVPLVVRMEGNNVVNGRKILNESGLKITAADDLADGAKKVVAQVK